MSSLKWESRVINKFCASIVIMILSLTACTWKNSDPSTDSASLVTTSSEVVIQQNQGLNVGESNAIWVAGLKPPANNTLTIMVHRIGLDPTKNYPKTTWSLIITNQDVVDAGYTGTRTMVSEWGLLMARGGKTPSLYLVDPVKGPVQTPLIAMPGNLDGGRATPLAYLVQRNGVARKFIGMVYQKPYDGISPVFHLERLWWDDNARQFVRVAPYEFSVPQMQTGAQCGVYKGFVKPCSVFNGNSCTPLFFGGQCGAGATFFGIRLDMDVDPPTPCPLDSCVTVLTPTQVDPPNKAFVSASHPTSGSEPFGSINDIVYSVSGDVATGDLFKSYGNYDTSDTSFDRINDLVYRVSRNEDLCQDGTRTSCACTPNPCYHSVISVFKKQCFTSNPNCSPLTTTNSKIFTDVGTSLGPTSDLQDGCVAVLSMIRPGEPGGATYVTNVYKACIRDPGDLTKGLSVMKIAEAEGAAYMYNDFTGATLGDRPQFVLFDFSARGMTGIKNARYEWTPKLGFLNRAIGLVVGVRCYAKGASPPAFTTIQLSDAYALPALPNCSGANVNMVEFQMGIIPDVRFTRLETLTVRATPF